MQVVDSKAVEESIKVKRATACAWIAAHTWRMYVVWLEEFLLREFPVDADEADEADEAAS